MRAGPRDGGRGSPLRPGRGAGAPRSLPHLPVSGLRGGGYRRSRTAGGRGGKGPPLPLPGAAAGFPCCRLCPRRRAGPGGRFSSRGAGAWGLPSPTAGAGPGDRSSPGPRGRRGPAAPSRAEVVVVVPPGSKGAGPHAPFSRGLAPGVGTAPSERWARVGWVGGRPFPGWHCPHMQVVVSSQLHVIFQCFAFFFFFFC